MTNDTNEYSSDSIETVWMTLPQAMAYLQVSRRTVYRLMDEGKLPFYRISGTRQRRFQKADLDKLMILDSSGAPAADEDDQDDA